MPKPSDFRQLKETGGNSVTKLAWPLSRWPHLPPFHATTTEWANDLPPYPIFTGKMDRATAHRHRETARLVHLLAAQCPVVRKLAGNEAFDRAAEQFVNSNALAGRHFSWYGEAFPAFIRTLGNAASFEYLADIATLEMARAKARRTMVLARVGARLFASVSASQFNRLRLTFHPSVSLVQSRFPIVTIWEANQSDDDFSFPQWSHESVLVAKIFQGVEMQQVERDRFAFLHALSNGATFAEAIEIAVHGNAKFNIGSNLAFLIDNNIVMRLHEEPLCTYGKGNDSARASGRVKS